MSLEVNPLVLRQARRISQTYIAAFCGICIVIAVAAFFWRGRIPGENLLLSLAQYDHRIQTGVWTVDILKVRQALRLQLVFWPIVATLIAAWWLLPRRIRDYCRQHAFQSLMTAGCTAALYLLFLDGSHEAEWYPLQKIMTDPGSMPIFGHRLLWVWLADALKALAPSLSYRQCYFISQIFPTALTVWMTGRWCALFIGHKLKWIGQILVVVMLAITFDYFTFYDISIVFFVTLCLYLLKKDRYFAFVAALGIATLNHENIMFLIPIAALHTFRNRRLCFLLLSASVIVHFGVRAALQAAVPLESHISLRFWTNLYYPLLYPKDVVMAVAALIFWWGAAALTWDSADLFLKRTAALLPLLGVAYFPVAQLHEPRAFDALIPVIIGFLLSYVAKVGKVQPVEA